MENMICWTEAIIAAYRRLPRAVAACKQTCSSLASSGFYCENTLELVQKMIDCNMRAESYINAKVLVDRVLEKLPLKNAKILYMRSHFNISMEDIATRLNYSKRSTFRWYAEGLKKAAIALKAQGYDEKWFEERYSKDVLVGDYYLQIKKGADVFGRAGRLSDCKKIRVRLEDAVAAGLLLGDKRAAVISCID